MKAVSAQANPDTPRLHRQEGRVLAALEPVISSRQLPIPRLHGMVDHPPWVALVLQDVAGRQPQLPWQAAELQQVVAAVDQLAQALTRRSRGRQNGSRPREPMIALDTDS